MGPDAGRQQSRTSNPLATGPQPPEQVGVLKAPSGASRLSLGQIVITPGAMEEIPPDEITAALIRHAQGDWGLVGGEDWKENDLSIREGCRVLSAYKTQAGTKFWIITEADRSSTCLLLPEEY